MYKRQNPYGGSPGTGAGAFGGATFGAIPGSASGAFGAGASTWGGGLGAGETGGRAGLGGVALEDDGGMFSFLEEGK